VKSGGGARVEKWAIEWRARRDINVGRLVAKALEYCVLVRTVVAFPPVRTESLDGSERVPFTDHRKSISELLWQSLRSIYAAIASRYLQHTIATASRSCGHSDLDNRRRKRMGSCPKRGRIIQCRGGKRLISKSPTWFSQIVGMTSSPLRYFRHFLALLEPHLERSSFKRFRHTRREVCRANDHDSQSHHCTHEAASPSSQSIDRRRSHPSDSDAYTPLAIIISPSKPHLDSPIRIPHHRPLTPHRNVRPHHILMCSLHIAHLRMRRQHQAPELLEMPK
jgi:hypothetical protein